MRPLGTYSLLTALIFASGALAQDPQGGWRRAKATPTEAAAPLPPPAPTTTTASASGMDAYGNPVGDQQPVFDGQSAPAQNSQLYPAQQYPPQQQYPQPMPPPAAGLPPQLVVRPGTYITARIDQPLSSDHNQPGDTFSATLMSPVVVDGVVVAQRGQMLTGRVVEAQRAGRASGTSRLGIELTGITLVDGQQALLRSHLVSRSGGTSMERDAAAIAGTTATGAAIGAAADWGRGAAIGAAAGAAAGAIGVLLTRGRATEVYPEAVLTFSVAEPVAVNTTRAPQAFRYVQPGDYQQQAREMRVVRPAPSLYPPYYAPYYGPYAYPYYSPWWGPGYYGGSFFFSFRGGRYYHRR